MSSASPQPVPLRASHARRASTPATKETGASPVAPFRRRVTQTDVARAAGVHCTTVSLALRDRTCIPEATRRRIQALAEKMGYTPDPTLQALIAYRKALSAGGAPQRIAYLTDAGGGAGLCRPELQARELCFLAARDAAAKLGYVLDHVWGDEGRGARTPAPRRDFAGVLIATHRAAANLPAEFDLNRISALRIGPAAEGPALHGVAPDIAANVRLAFRTALAAGYRRIGLVLPRAWDDAADGAWSAGFRAEQARATPLPALPIWLQQTDAAGARPASRTARPTAPTAFVRWIEAQRPDLILGSFPLVAPLLESCGLLVPRDLAFADLLNETGDSGMAGLRHNVSAVGALAVELLVRLMQSNVRGLPAVPTTTLVQGSWHDGASMPAAADRTLAGTAA